MGFRSQYNISKRLTIELENVYVTVLNDKISRNYIMP